MESSGQIVDEFELLKRLAVGCTLNQDHLASWYFSSARRGIEPVDKALASRMIAGGFIAQRTWSRAYKHRTYKLEPAGERLLTGKGWEETECH